MSGRRASRQGLAEGQLPPGSSVKPRHGRGRGEERGCWALARRPPSHTLDLKQSPHICCGLFFHHSPALIFNQSPLLSV